MVANARIVVTFDESRQIDIRRIVANHQLPVVVRLAKDALDGPGQPFRVIPDRYGYRKADRERIMASAWSSDVSTHFRIGGSGRSNNNGFYNAARFGTS